MFRRSLFHRSRSPSSLTFLDKCEHFVPFRVDVLMDRILADRRLTEEQASQFQELRKMLASRFHYEYRKILESLKREFAVFDPDPDTLDKPEDSDTEFDEKYVRLNEAVKSLLTRCNYIAMTPDQLDACLELQPVGGLSVFVDKKDFSTFDVFFRGVRKDTVEESRFFLFRQKWKTVIFSRVVVLARSNEANKDRFFIKIFKDVSVENLKIVVPKVRLGMPVFDRLKISGTVFGSLATTLYKVVFAFMLSWWLFAVILSSLVVAAFRGVFSFLNSRTKYLHVFSSSLYYLSVSNNEAALTTLIDTAEEQELKESLLAYFMLFVLRNRQLTIQQLDEAVEHWLLEQFEFDVDFEVDDAMDKLKKFGLVASQGPIDKVYDLPTVLRRLDEAWDNFFPYYESGGTTNDRVADGDWPPFPTANK